MRLLLDTHICQAMEHNLTIVTVDAAICAYTNNVLR